MDKIKKILSIIGGAVLFIGSIAGAIFISRGTRPCNDDGLGDNRGIDEQLGDQRELDSREGEILESARDQLERDGSDLELEEELVKRDRDLLEELRERHSD